MPQAIALTFMIHAIAKASKAARGRSFIECNRIKRSLGVRQPPHAAVIALRQQPRMLSRHDLSVWQRTTRGFSEAMRSSFILPLCERFADLSDPRPCNTRTMCSMGCLDTIFALSSGAGVAAGVAVIRISGHEAVRAATSLLKKPGSFPEPRYAVLRRLYHPQSREELDQALVLFFPGPKSFTGEDVVELHIHGSRAVISAVTEALLKSDLRPAERGEFTRRAFENGRMDLTEVEGLADLIASDTDAQRRQALRQLRGEMRAVFEDWRERIKACLAHAEAVIDFGEDVDDGTFEDILPRVVSLRNEMRQRLDDNRRGEIVRDGIHIAIIGPPNAGKSTLLNILAGRPAAIVSSRAGTTRDVVEVHLDLRGLPVTVRDTAGLRENAQDEVEVEGMRRALEVATTSELILYVQDATDLTGIRSTSTGEPVFDVKKSVNFADELLRQSGIEPSLRSKCMLVVNKIDLLKNYDASSTEHGEVYFTSFARREGIDALLNGIEAAVQHRLSKAGNGGCESDDFRPDLPVITRARHRFHIEKAAQALDVFAFGRTGPERFRYLPMDLATEELRIASRELGAITGAINVEEVLDIIFRDFCIGK